MEKFASDLGVACGLAFSPDGTLFVGDRSGTLFRVNAAGRATPFASLPPSVAAFHLAIDAEEAVYVAGPTLSSVDSIYRVDRRGEVSVLATGFGRPQGLAFDRDGRVARGRSAGGGERTLPSDARRPPRAGRLRCRAWSGVAFHPERGLVVATNDTLLPGGCRPAVTAPRHGPSRLDSAAPRGIECAVRGAVRAMRQTEASLQLFQRKPIAELLVDSDRPDALKRVLGAGDLIMLAIGAVIGAGIFGAIGTAAAGQLGAERRESSEWAPGRRSSSRSCCSAARARWRRSATRNWPR